MIKHLKSGKGIKHFYLTGVWFAILFLFSAFPVVAQDRGEAELHKVIVKEWNISLFLNTSGGGIGFQHGRTPTYYDKHFWEIDFLYNAHEKSVRAKNPYYSGATSYCYGKLYDLFFLRGGYGYQRTIHQKPYWGGVRIRYTLSGGFSLGMGLPVYLYIYKVTEGGFIQVAERYDPEKHNLDNIIGRGPLLRGFLETAFRPGFYFKTGLNFDFSKNEETMHILEIGATIDMLFPPLQQMAYNKAKPFYLCGYIAYNFGKRKGNYE